MNAAHKLLRDATAGHHERVDAAFSAFDLTTRDGYGNFLAAQAAAYLPIEAALDEAGAVDLLPDWPDRKRGDALRSDMASMGVVAEEPQRSPTFDNSGQIWGTLYVIEGSRLGPTLFFFILSKSRLGVLCSTS
jgi:heme oxygenase (biliverdin-IX-beta and delta-forming)